MRSTISARALLGIAALALLASIGPPAAAAPTTKYFTATLSVGSTSPPEVGAGSDQVLTLTLANSAGSQQYLGSANVTIPAGFSLTAGKPSRDGWTAAISTDGLLMLRNEGPSTTKALAPGQALNLNLSGTMAATPGTYTFTTRVKQSNDFSGTGNDFRLADDASQPTVVVTAVSLRFSAQPQTQLVGQLLPRIQVQSTDSHGNPVSLNGQTATLASVPKLPAPCAGVTTTCSTTSTFTGSVANFDAVAFGELGDYQLVATAGSVTSPESAVFSIVQRLESCAAGSTQCSATVGDLATLAATVEATTDTAAATLTLSAGGALNRVAPPPRPCRSIDPETGLPIADVVSFAVDNRSKVVTLRLDQHLVQLIPNNGAGVYTICYQAPDKFRTRSGDWALEIVTPIGPQFYGLLPDCRPRVGPPCVLSQHKNEGDLITRVQAPPGDPKITY